LEEKLEQHLEDKSQPEIVMATAEIVTEPVATVVEPETIAEEEVVTEEEIENTAVEDESFEDNDTNEEEDQEDHEGGLVVDEEEVVEEVVEEVIEEVIEEEPVFAPIFELTQEEENEDEEVEIEEKEVEEKEVEKEESIAEIKTPKKEVKLDELLGENYTEPVFVKPNEITLFSTPVEEDKPKSVILNDTISKTIDVGLNDKIAFVKHLFDDSTEDFNRVISQLNTFDSYDEAKNFINEMVIPDYNYWVGEEEYVKRFMEIVEKKFL
jgi:hypothetical protein